MISTKKYGVGFKDKMGPFSLHDASRFMLTYDVMTICVLAIAYNVLW